MCVFFDSGNTVITLVGVVLKALPGLCVKFR